MKRIFIAAFLLASFFVNAQSNILLNTDFWKKNPNITLVQQEINKGNNPSEANGGNHDVVSMSINSGANIDIIKFLIDQPGNSVDKLTHDGRLYIHWAASKGNIELIKYLIEKGSDINRTDDKGATALVFAASNGQLNPEVYELFFNSGVKIDQKYANGANILLLAVANDTDLKLSEYLVSKGLKINSVDDFGRTAFDYAARNGNIELLNKISNKGVKATSNALLFAAQGSRFKTNDLETFKYLIEKLKIKANATDETGATALHYIVKKGKQQDIINYFLSKKVDVNVVDNNGDNIFMVASGAKDIETVKQLLPKLKNINSVNKNGESALFLAVQNGTPEIVEYLITNGANVKLDSKNGNLAYALVQSYKKPRPGQNSDEFVQKLQILKNKGVDFSTKQADGSSLYHTAVVKNDVNLLKLLEGLNIDINATDKQGLTPLHKAAMIGQDDVILKYLLAKGASKNKVTEFEETAFDLASENEYFSEKNVNIEFLR